MLFHYLPLKSMESAQKIIPGILRLPRFRWVDYHVTYLLMVLS